MAATLAAAACSRGAAPGPSPGPSASTPAGAAPEIDATTPLPDPLPAIAARVNGHAIPTAFVSLVADEIVKKGGGGKSREYVYRKTLQDLIDRELLVEEALSRGITVDGGRVLEVYNESRIRYRNEEDWATHLANDGLTRDAFRAQIRAQLTAQALVEAEGARAGTTVTDDEAKAFYDGHPGLFESGEKVRVSHILLRVAPGSAAGGKAARRAAAESVVDRLRKGADFATLARRLSDDKGTASGGGVLPPFGRGQVDPALEAAAFALKPGEISNVVETSAGFEVVKLLEIVPSVRQPFLPVRERIKQVVLLDRRQQRVAKLLAELRSRARIETYL
jgi:parvulin-like peptidyl-prolyl isomerase